MGRAASASGEAVERLQLAAATLFQALMDRKYRVACAESCTGGMVTAAITGIPGSSAVLWGGIVAYSNESKSRFLGVAPDTIAKNGAVSREVARAMARGAMEASGTELAIAITGIAGPDGGTSEKPVGLVWFGFRFAPDPRGMPETVEESEIFRGDRKAIREAAAEKAMLRAAQLVADPRY